MTVADITSASYRSTMFGRECAAGFTSLRPHDVIEHFIGYDPSHGGVDRPLCEDGNLDGVEECQLRNNVG